jgi:hypothetical protein
MKKIALILLCLAPAFAIVGCSDDKPIDDSKPAPKPQFKMIPSQKSGSTGTADDK